MINEVVTAAVTAAREVVEQSDRLGLTWTLRPATVITGTLAFLDGDTTAASAVNIVPLQGPFAPGERIMCLLIPETGIIYGIGHLGNLPIPGSLVARVRQETNTQTLTTAVDTFITFDTVDYDPYGGFSAALNDRWTFPFAGIFQVHGNVKYAANATSRRAALLNLNGTSSGTGTIGGQSLQTPATGTCQVDATGVALVTATEYVGLRALQNSGGNLATSTTDGGSFMEIIYVGQDIS